LRRTLARVGVAIVAVATLAGCYIPGQTTTAPPDKAAAEKADQALKELQGQVLSKGPNGEDPAKVTAADMTPDQIN
jgi:ribose transport system substrate-binding protein